MKHKAKKHKKLPIQSTKGYSFSVNNPNTDMTTAASHPFNPLYGGNSQYEDPKGSSLLRFKKHKKRKPGDLIKKVNESKKHHKKHKVGVHCKGC